MKTSKIISYVFMMFLVALTFTTSSCDTLKLDCDGMGTLQLTNKSLNTVQRIMIDGVNHGTIDPNEKKDFKLAPGQHVFQQVGLSGGSGCSIAYVIIVECETSGFSCNN